LVGSILSTRRPSIGWQLCTLATVPARLLLLSMITLLLMAPFGRRNLVLMVSHQRRPSTAGRSARAGRRVDSRPRQFFAPNVSSFLLGVGIFSPKITNRTELSRTELKCRFFRFFGSASVFNYVYFGVRFRLRFSLQTELIHRTNRVICKPSPPTTAVDWPK
jgi:hypothetical protein